MALRSTHVLIWMVLGVLGLAGLLAPAAEGFTFTPAPGSPYQLNRRLPLRPRQRTLRRRHRRDADAHPHVLDRGRVHGGGAGEELGRRDRDRDCSAHGLATA